MSLACSVNTMCKTCIVKRILGLNTLANVRQTHIVPLLRGERMYWHNERICFERLASVLPREHTMPIHTRAIRYYLDMERQTHCLNIMLDKKTWTAKELEEQCKHLERMIDKTVVYRDFICGYKDRAHGDLIRCHFVLRAKLAQYICVIIDLIFTMFELE